MNTPKTVTREIVEFLAIVIFIVLPFRLFVAKPFIVNGASMLPTFNEHDYLIVDQLSYRFYEPKRGDVVIFRYPVNPSRFFIKRIIGIPGDTIVSTEGSLSVFPKEATEPIVYDEPFISMKSTDTFEVTVPEGQYFVMGDNRTGSFDSRSWGTVEKNALIGKALLRLYPFNSIGVWPGHTTYE